MIGVIHSYAWKEGVDPTPGPFGDRAPGTPYARFTVEISGPDLAMIREPVDERDEESVRLDRVIGQSIVARMRRSLELFDAGAYMSQDFTRCQACGLRPGKPDGSPCDDCAGKPA
jgi:hypothetical protein